jgi:Tol biopolymer transport system component/C-terminal processing protease CtpA/Prc
MAPRSRTTRLVALLLVALLGPVLEAREEAGGRPMRLPESLALSPDGATLVISWRDDLWRVGEGGRCRRLTYHPAEDRRPHISPDGRLIAFASNRSGVEQVHVMPVTGGAPHQVTFHSEGARPYGWFPDSDSVLIRSRRDHDWRRADRLFRKSLDPKEAPELLFDGVCGWGAVSPDGRRVAFTRGGMPWWRKGYRGPTASRIWIRDLETGRFDPVSPGGHGELWPMWSADGSALFFVSEEDGTWNIWRHRLRDGVRTQVTHFRDDGVNYPAIAAGGTRMVFRRLGDVYELALDGSDRTARLPLVDAGDPTIDPVAHETVNRASDVAFADDAREIAFVAGGDIWVMDTELREPRQITNTPHEERDPVFSRDFKTIFFISDAVDHPDVWRARRADEERHWWQNDRFRVDRLTDDEAVESELRLTPDGKHLAFLRTRGDLWIMGLDGGEPRRLVASCTGLDFTFSPDGRWVAYAKLDDDFNSDIWIRSVQDGTAPVNVSVHPDNDHAPAWSPDGRVLAFTGRRWTEESDVCYVWLRKEDAETDARQRILAKALETMKGRGKEQKKKKGKAKKPGGKREDEPKEEPRAPTAVALRDPLAGTWRGRLAGPPPLPDDGLDLALEIRKAGAAYAGSVEVVGQFSGALESLAYEVAGGRLTFALTTPLGPLAGEGTVEDDAMEGTWTIEGLMQGTFEARREAPPAPAAPKEEADEEEEEADDADAVVVDFEKIADRVLRVEIPDANESGLIWSPDSKKLAFRATIKGVAGLYTIEFPEPGQPKLLTRQAGTSPRWLKTGNQIAWLVGGVPATLTTAGKAAKFPFSVRHTRDVRATHGAAFEVAWRTMRDTYYDGLLGGRDWDAVKAKYLPLARAAATPFELQTVVNCMLGELNGSHLGFRARDGGWERTGWTDVTGHLGARWDPTYGGPGLRVRDVIAGTPAYEERHRLRAGEIVLAIDGRAVGPETNLDRLLTGDPRRTVTVRVRGEDGAERTVHLRPTTYDAVRRRLYDHTVERQREKVADASGGHLGYLHVRGMNWSSFLRFEAELYRIGHGKDGLIIDVRNNGGGFTTDHLLTCLTQPRHAVTVPRGGGPGYPQDRMVYAPWHKPIVVLCNENSFSNAEIFSHAIKSLGRGPIVGVQTAGGVISTGRTDVMDLGSLRLPFRGWYVASTGEDMELNGCVPDHVVWPEPGDAAAGIDRQLDKAIEILRADVETWQARSKPVRKPASTR